MEDNVKKKKGFFSNLLKSIKDFEKYEDFALEGMKKSLKYIFYLLILFCIILSIVASFLICKRANMMYQDLKNNGSNFTFKDNILNVDSENSIVIDKYNEFLGTVIIDTSENISEEECIDKTKPNNVGIILLKDKIILINNTNNVNIKMNYEDLTNSLEAQFGEKNFEINNKQELIDKIQNINALSFILAIFFAFFLSNIILYIVIFGMYVLVLTLLAFLIARISRIKINFSNSFGIAVHAITLPIILNLIYSIINSLTEFEIKYFDWMYNTIAYIYVIVAILMIKTDFINRQLQLLKIAEAKKEIKKDVNENPEEEKPPVDEDKKEKKKDKNEDEGQDSLNGSEA